MAEEFDPLLMLASTAHDGVGLIVDKPYGRGRRASTSTDYFSLWDAQDHCYDQKEDCDVMVNTEHSYYQRVDQFNLPDNLEHSYAFPILTKSEGSLNGLLPLPVDDLDLELCCCRWIHCEYVCESVEQLHNHIALEHLTDYSKTCYWIDCKRDKKPFAKRYLLQRHLDTHIAYKSFRCEECTMSFTTAERLRLHRNTRHHPEVRYMCEQCHEMFKTTSDRAHHIERVHMKARLICPHCRKLYAGRSSLRKHLPKCPRAALSKTIPENTSDISLFP